MEPIDFPFKFDEMPLAGRLIFESFVRDQELFVQKYPVFDDVFKNRFQEYIQHAQRLVCCSCEGQKIQSLRKSIHRKLDNLHAWVVEAREEVGVEYILVMDEFEMAIRREDLTMVIALGRRIQGMLDGDNERYKNTIVQELESFLGILELDKLEVKRLLGSRGMLTQEIFSCLNHLWAIMQDVMEIGRSIYQEGQMEGGENYLLANLKLRLKNYHNSVEETI